MPNDISDEELSVWIDGEQYVLELDIENGHTNQPIRILGSAKIKDEPEQEGFNCCKCGEYYEYAKANQADGTFKCWGCRH